MNTTPLEDAYQAAKLLPPDERLRLSLRIWGSLPSDYGATPSSAELAEVFYRVHEFDAGRSARSPWEIVFQSLAFRLGRISAKIYSAPRRFDLATIFVVMAGFSLLMGVMSWFKFEPLVSLFIFALIAFVGVAQAVLFGGRMPRLASLLVGVLGVLVVATSELLGQGRTLPADDWVGLIFRSIVAGTILGYFAGVLVGAVFMVADKLRKKMSGEKEPDDAPGEHPRAFSHSPDADLSRDREAPSHSSPTL